MTMVYSYLGVDYSKSNGIVARGVESGNFIKVDLEAIQENHEMLKPRKVSNNRYVSNGETALLIMNMSGDVHGGVLFPAYINGIDVVGVLRGFNFFPLDKSHTQRTTNRRIRAAASVNGKQMTIDEILVSLKLFGYVTPLNMKDNGMEIHHDNFVWDSRAIMYLTKEQHKSMSGKCHRQLATISHL